MSKMIGIPMNTCYTAPIDMSFFHSCKNWIVWKSSFYFQSIIIFYCRHKQLKANMLKTNVVDFNFQFNRQFFSPFLLLLFLLLLMTYCEIINSSIMWFCVQFGNQIGKLQWQKCTIQFIIVIRINSWLAHTNWLKHTIFHFIYFRCCCCCNIRLKSALHILTWPTLDHRPDKLW